jgi:hypothetical protein
MLVCAGTYLESCRFKNWPRITGCPDRDFRQTFLEMPGKDPQAGKFFQIFSIQYSLIVQSFEVYGQATDSIVS